MKKRRGGRGFLLVVAFRHRGFQLWLRGFGGGHWVEGGEVSGCESGGEVAGSWEVLALVGWMGCWSVGRYPVMAAPAITRRDLDGYSS